MSQEKHNQYLEDLYKSIKERFSVEALNMSTTEWLMANTTLKGKPFSTSRYPFQRQIADDMHNNLCCKKPSQVGLSLSLDTPIFTTKGWKTMDTLKVGDTLFDERGEKTKITYKSPVWENRDCYEITFCTGEKIVCDGSHRWYVENDVRFNPNEGFANKNTPKKIKEFSKTGVVNTEFLHKNHFLKAKRFAIPNTEPLKGVDEETIGPYTLGIWLGDGDATGSRVTCSIEDAEFLKASIELEGYTVKLKSSKSLSKKGCHTLSIGKRGDSSFFKDLKRLKLLNNKSIPTGLILQSEKFRRSLTAGLMDSDGCVSGASLIFSNTNTNLIEGFSDLITSLGYKYSVCEIKPKTYKLKNDKKIIGRKTYYQVKFTTHQGCELTILPRKRNNLRDKKVSRSSQTRRRFITNVKKVSSVPTQCITVDSANHLFLAGKGMIPTHNTEIQIRKAAAFLARNKSTKLIFSLPNDDMYRRISVPRIRPIIDGDKVFNPPAGTKPTRSMGLMQILNSYMYIVAAGESAATSIDADAVFMDEVDLSDQQTLALFNSRMQNSDYRIKQAFSTPTYPNFGIDALYDISDKHVYYRKCDSCNHYNDPQFTRRFIHIPGLPPNIEDLTQIEKVHLPSLKLNESYVKCERCGSQLDMANHETSRWISNYGDSPHLPRGYKVSPFSTERLPPEYIVNMLMDYRSKENTRGFYNTVLGEAYSDGNIQISEELIKKAFEGTSFQVPEVGDDVPVWMAIDVGNICHIILASGTSADNLKPFMFKVLNVDHLIEFVKKVKEDYNLVGGAIDREPYTPLANEIRDITEGRVLPVDYARVGITIKKDALDDISYATIGRTEVIDFVHTRMKRMDLKFNGYGNFETSITTHLRDMVREEEPEKPTTWKKLTNNDHFFHCLAFLLCAPNLRDVMDYKDKEDKRQSILFSGTEYGKNEDSDNLFNFDGSSYKRSVDSNIITRVLR